MGTFLLVGNQFPSLSPQLQSIHYHSFICVESPEASADSTEIGRQASYNLDRLIDFQKGNPLIFLIKSLFFRTFELKTANSLANHDCCVEDIMFASHKNNNLPTSDRVQDVVPQMKR